MSTRIEDIQLSIEDKKRIAEAADRVGRPWAEVLSNALKNYRPVSRQPANGATKKTVYEQMLEDGVLGILKDGPSDLSTNPKYMEGFGE